MVPPFRNAIRAPWLLTTLSLLTLSALLVLAVHGDNGVLITGAHVSNHVAVDQKVDVQLHLESNTTISSVILSYTDRAGIVVNATMNLLQGSQNDGWWIVTIEPAIFQTNSQGLATYRLPSMILFVGRSGAVSEVSVDPHLMPSWSVQTSTSQSTLGLNQVSSPKTATALAGGLLGFVTVGLVYRRRMKRRA